MLIFFVISQQQLVLSDAEVLRKGTITDTDRLVLAASIGSSVSPSPQAAAGGSAGSATGLEAGLEPESIESTVSKSFKALSVEFTLRTNYDAVFLFSVFFDV
jgi:hypothetical protein